jgi:FkbH-like protein
MKLREAMQIVREKRTGQNFTLALACGFEPLHLATFLKAELMTRMPGGEVSVISGVFGDLTGNVTKLAVGGRSAMAVVIEWADLDPRLGVRRAGGWGPGDGADISSEVSTKLAELLAILRGLNGDFPVVVVMPTIAMAPAFWTRHGAASAAQLRLAREVADFAVDAAAIPGTSVLDLSVPGDAMTRYDVSSDLASGFPYTLDHASQLAAGIAVAVAPAPLKKGIITDLDDTVWRGIAGDDGVGALSWNLENGTQVHGLYQQALAAIAASGGLVAVASKNDPDVVSAAFRRPDMLIAENQLFPFELNWQEKSASVGRILSAWNIGAEDVVFVDDSALEIAEVAAAYPGITCLRFPSDDPRGVYELIHELRRMFGKRTITEEDRTRAATIRTGQPMRDASAMREDFLAGLSSRISFSDSCDAADQRPLELINKTNQFNLNGRRISESALASQTRRANALFLVASYTDKFGSLGRIAVIVGEKAGKTTRIESWVMSCRAFSRRIEYQCMDEVFLRTGCDALELAFQKTDRNSPFIEFMESVGAERTREGYIVRRAIFDDRKPTLHIAISE